MWIKLKFIKLKLKVNISTFDLNQYKILSVQNSLLMQINKSEKSAFI